MSSRDGANDPADWYNRWQSLHDSASFPGHLSELVISTLRDPRTLDGVGIETITYEEEDGRWIVIKVSYLVETYPDGRVFHILWLWSPGDPAPDAGGSMPDL